MSFDWSDYLILARDMETTAYSSSTPEARLRSCVSRAYYAAFCKARNCLLDKGTQIPKNVNVHKFVPDKLKQSRDVRCQRVGIDLHRLRKDRNKADYDDRVSRLASIAQNALKMADNILNALKTI